jgi:hypothetical protein
MRVTLERNLTLRRLDGFPLHAELVRIVFVKDDQVYDVGQGPLPWAIRWFNIQRKFASEDGCQFASVEDHTNLAKPNDWFCRNPAQKAAWVKANKQL